MPEDTKFIRADVEDISWGSRGCDNATGGDAYTSKTEERVSGGGTGGGGKGRGTASGRLWGDGDGNGGDSPTSTPRWREGFDLLVGADGPDSFVRNETMSASLGAEAAGAAAPQRRGYVVYRGVCSSGSGGSAASGAVEAGGEEGGWGLDSFQTWGPGLRFASVPLAGDERVREWCFFWLRWNTRVWYLSAAVCCWFVFAKYEFRQSVFFGFFWFSCFGGTIQR